MSQKKPDSKDNLPLHKYLTPQLQKIKKLCKDIEPSSLSSTQQRLLTVRSVHTLPSGWNLNWSRALHRQEERATFPKGPLTQVCRGDSVPAKEDLAEMCWLHLSWQASLSFLPYFLFPVSWQSGVTAETVVAVTVFRDYESPCRIEGRITSNDPIEDVHTQIYE